MKRAECQIVCLGKKQLKCYWPLRRHQNGKGFPGRKPVKKWKFVQAKVLLSPNADHYLSNKACKFKISKKQKSAIDRLFSKLKQDPHCGKTLPYLPVSTPFYIHSHIGENLHLELFYDLQKIKGEMIAYVRSAFLGYKM